MLNGAFAIMANGGNPTLTLTGINAAADVAISASTIDDGGGNQVASVTITLTGDNWGGVDSTKIDVSGSSLTVASDLFNNLSFNSGNDFTQIVALNIQDLTITNAASVTFTTAANDFNSVSIQSAGSVQLVDTDDLTVNSVSVTTGNISVTTGGQLDVNAAGTGISALGVGTINLFADGGANGDLVVNDVVTSVNGDITLRADDDITFGPGGDVSSTSGDIILNADFDNGGAASGALTMVDGTVIDAGSGTIDVDADENIAIGQLNYKMVKAS